MDQGEMAQLSQENGRWCVGRMVSEGQEGEMHLFPTQISKGKVKGNTTKEWIL